MYKHKLSNAKARRMHDIRPPSQYHQDFTSWLILSNIIIDDSCNYENSSSSFSSSSDSCSSRSSDNCSSNYSSCSSDSSSSSSCD